MDNWKYDEEDEYEKEFEKYKGKGRMNTKAIDESDPECRKELPDVLDEKEERILGYTIGIRLCVLICYCPIGLWLVFSSLTVYDGKDGFFRGLFAVFFLLFTIFFYFMAALLPASSVIKYKDLINKPMKKCIKNLVTITVYLIIISLTPLLAIDTNYLLEDYALPIAINCLLIYYASLGMELLINHIRNSLAVGKKANKFADIADVLLSPLTVFLYSVAIFPILPWTEVWHYVIFYLVFFIVAVVYTIINIIYRKVRKNKNEEELTGPTYDVDVVRFHASVIFVTFTIIFILMAGGFKLCISAVNVD